jgi:hypothetical protein
MVAAFHPVSRAVFPIGSIGPWSESEAQHTQQKTSPAKAPQIANVNRCPEVIFMTLSYR